ncbi:hypothetical protein [Thiolapillus sp.]
MSAIHLLLMLLPGALLFAWSMWKQDLACLTALMLMLPVLGLIALNMLEVALMRRRAMVGMYLRAESALARLLCRKTVLLLWQVVKATFFTFILFMEALDWQAWFWLVLLVDIPVMFLIHRRVRTALRTQAKPGLDGIVSRRMLVTLNTLVLAMLLAGGQMFSRQTDYQGLSWQDTALHAAQQQQLRCELLAPLARMKAIQQALASRAIRQGLESVNNVWSRIGGWLLFFFWSGLSLWAWSRMLLATLISRQDMDRLIHQGCRHG